MGMKRYIGILNFMLSYRIGVKVIIIWYNDFREERRNSRDMYPCCPNLRTTIHCDTKSFILFYILEFYFLLLVHK